MGAGRLNMAGAPGRLICGGGAGISNGIWVGFILMVAILNSARDSTAGCYFDLKNSLNYLQRMLYY